jgi:hypothetical protein
VALKVRRRSWAGATRRILRVVGGRAALCRVLGELDSNCVDPLRREELFRGTSALLFVGILCVKGYKGDQIGTSLGTLVGWNTSTQQRTRAIDRLSLWKGAKEHAKSV